MCYSGTVDTPNIKFTLKELGFNTCSDIVYKRSILRKLMLIFKIQRRNFGINFNDPYVVIFLLLFRRNSTLITYQVVQVECLSRNGRFHTRFLVVVVVEVSFYVLGSGTGVDYSVVQLKSFQEVTRHTSLLPFVTGFTEVMGCVNGSQCQLNLNLDFFFIR